MCNVVEGGFSYLVSLAKPVIVVFVHYSLPNTNAIIMKNRTEASYVLDLMRKSDACQCISGRSWYLFSTGLYGVREDRLCILDYE